jgi:hypothetical protein
MWSVCHLHRRLRSKLQRCTHVVLPTRHIQQIQRIRVLLVQRNRHQLAEASQWRGLASEAAQSIHHGTRCRLLEPMAAGPRALRATHWPPVLLRSHSQHSTQATPAAATDRLHVGELWACPGTRAGAPAAGPRDGGRPDRRRRPDRRECRPPRTSPATPDRRSSPPPPRTSHTGPRVWDQTPPPPQTPCASVDVSSRRRGPDTSHAAGSPPSKLHTAHNSTQNKSRAPRSRPPNRKPPCRGRRLRIAPATTSTRSPHVHHYTRTRRPPPSTVQACTPRWRHAPTQPRSLPIAAAQTTACQPRQTHSEHREPTRAAWVGDVRRARGREREEGV